MSPHAPSRVQYSFGPGGITPAVRAIIFANIATFIVTLFAPTFIIGSFGLTPGGVYPGLQIWQLATYLFVHSPTNFGHILFNMLAVWMFGVELERRWGTEAFTKFYFVSGVGAGLTTMAVAFLPGAIGREMYVATTIGASGSVYGLLMAWAILFPHRQILFMLIFPLSARIYVLIMGAIAFFSAVGTSGSAVANVAHLGGLLFGYLYLKGPTDLRLEFKYRLTKWRMDRMRRKFNVHKGGKNDWEKHIH